MANSVIIIMNVNLYFCEARYATYILLYTDTLNEPKYNIKCFNCHDKSNFLKAIITRETIEL